MLAAHGKLGVHDAKAEGTGDAEEAQQKWVAGVLGLGNGGSHLRRRGRGAAGGLAVGDAWGCAWGCCCRRGGGVVIAGLRRGGRGRGGRGVERVCGGQSL